MMPTQEESDELVTILLANANIARKALLFANKKINAAIDESEFSRWELSELLQFITMFSHGTDREEIFGTLHMSAKLADKLTNMKELNW